MMFTVPLIDATFPKVEPRLGRQTAAVYRMMQNGEWWTFGDLQFWLKKAGIGISEAGVSARIRDLRKPQCGGHVIERKLIGKGLWAYRLVI